MNILQALEGYLLAGGGNHLSPSTLKINTWGIRTLSSCIGDKEVTKISINDLDHYFVWLQHEYIGRYSERISTASVVNAWKAIRSFYAWMVKNKLVKKNISLSIRMPDNPDVEIWPYSKEEIQRMFDGCTRKRNCTTPDKKPFTMSRPTAVRDTALLSILLDTGIRSMECCRLQVDDVDMKTGSVWVEPWGTRRKSKGRHVYISDITKHNLWLYLINHKTGTLFLTLNNRPFDRSSLLQAVGWICLYAEIKNPTVHRFRHTFAVQYILNGGDPFTLMRLLGHTTMRMVNRYLEFTQADLATVHRKASPMDNWFGK
jgi:integrase